MRLNAIVIDRRTRERCEIVHIERVPAQRDLLGRRLPGHRRYVVRFSDGRWQNDRTAEDLIESSE